MTSPSDDLRAGGPVVPQQTTTRECGCRPGNLLPTKCVLHLALDSLLVPRMAHDILVRALFAAAGRVAAGAEPADAVAAVRERFGI